MVNDLLDTEKLVRWAHALVRFPSAQTELFEADPQVQGLLDGPVIDILREIGLTWRRDAMGGVIVEINGSGDGPSLMLMAYAMTHPGNRMTDPFGGTLVNDGGRLRGRGLAEQKGALAAALGAVAALKDARFNGRLTLAITAAGETGRHDAARALLDTLDHVPDATLIVVGTSGRLALANKGRIDVEVTVRGKASHSSTPHAGVDAIAGARQVLDRVLALDIGRTEHPGLGKATLVATSIRSWPEATHTVQDEVRLVFDRRLLPGDDADAAFAAIAAASDLSEPFRVDCRRGPHMYPAEILRDGRMARAVLTGCAMQGLPPAATFHSSGALDAGLFCEAGKEAAMWGPGNIDLWHSDEESIGVNELADGALGYLGFVRSYFGN